MSMKRNASAIKNCRKTILMMCASEMDDILLQLNAVFYLCYFISMHTKNTCEIVWTLRKPYIFLAHIVKWKRLHHDSIFIYFKVFFSCAEEHVTFDIYLLVCVLCIQYIWALYEGNYNESVICFWKVLHSLSAVYPFIPVR